MSGFFKGRVPLRDIAASTSHLAQFVRAGIPLLKSLELIEKEFGHPHLKSALSNVASRVRGGGTFADALRQYPQLFNSFYVGLVEGGEMSGKLEDVLERAATVLEQEIDLKNKVTLAVAYPGFVLILGLLTILFLMAVIVPKISVIYSEFGGSLPLITSIVISASRWALPAGAVVVIVLFGMGVALKGGKTDSLKKALDEMSLSLPWVRTLVLQAEVARFARAAGMLLESGVPLLQAITVASRTVVNGRIQRQLQGTEKIVAQGKSFSEALRRETFFPESALNLVWIGESTGRLDQSLQKLGEMADKDVDHQVKLMTTLLEPLIIVIVGLIVGVIVIGLLLPIFQMSVLVQ